MRPIYTLILILLAISASAQQQINGNITDRNGSPVSFANVYLEGSYDGSTSDTTGSFTLKTTLSGRQILIASFIGFEKQLVELDLDTLGSPLHIVLEEAVSELNEVVITAGIFSVSDEKKSATLSSYDIASTASAVGDIYGAYATMPGSQKVGEEGMLFVRGGESYETRTYMDGMVVQSPYFSSMPHVPTRGRFSPLLFSETLFSTGGYSAEYGHALSSIVDLSTNGLEIEDKASAALMSVGANASWAKRWEKSSLAVTGLYANNFLTNKVFKTNMDWTKDPVLGDGMLMFRQQVGEKGLLKSFGSFNSMTMRMNYDNFEAGTLDDVQMDNLNLYTNTSYTDQLADGLSFDIFDAVKIDVPVIFITAFQEYAIKAFKVNSVDYLLKPVRVEDLQAALDKYRRYFNRELKAPSIGGDLLHSIREMISRPCKTRFMVRAGEHIRSIEVEDILYFFSLQKGTFLHTSDKRNYVIDYTLGGLEEVLDPRLFHRINRKFLVSHRAITDLTTLSSSKLKVRLMHAEDEDIFISRDRMASFKEWLDR
ncbi:MAG: LytTR family transcriptional regulator DNA-binding domain-containing protein [Bacteroidales bacterium]|nr:LytTR family transcriptional regulator DNA-binding domain-containing protein [Bacteroidales bacterium]